MTAAITRDKTLDRLRSLAMFWVLLVHVFYWTDYFAYGIASLLRSFFLFEMPLFFFILGAGSSFGRKEPYLSYVLKRFRRILIPYWVFAAICAAITLVSFALRAELSLPLAIDIIISWLVPADRQISSENIFIAAIWFVPVFLCLTLLMPFLKAAGKGRFRAAFTLVPLLIFLAMDCIGLEWLQQLAFYSLWAYIGLFYSEITALARQKKGRVCFACIFICAVALMLALGALGFGLDMQQNKFPPDPVFLVYSLGMMSLVMLLLPLLDKLFGLLERCKPIEALISLFSKRSLTIFLYQVFAFSLSIPLANSLAVGNRMAGSVIRGAFCLILCLILCSVFAVVFGRIEDLGK